MEIRERRFSASAIFAILFLSLVPVGAIGIASASTSPSTQVSLSGNYITTADGILVTNSDIEISFNVTVPSGNFTQGTYAYSGVVQGNGSFNETGTTIEISSVSSGYATLTYFANSTNGSESPNQMEILFDQSPPIPIIIPIRKFYTGSQRIILHTYCFFLWQDTSELLRHILVR